MNARDRDAKRLRLASRLRLGDHRMAHQDNSLMLDGFPRLRFAARLFVRKQDGRFARGDVDWH
jgi:hypothetical protein